MVEVSLAQLRLGLVEFNGTFFFTIANLIIMFLIIKFKLFAPINDFMKKREEEIGKQYDDAQKAEDKANELRAQYEAKLSGAREEGENIVREHIAKAEVRAQEIIKNADSEVKKQKERASKEIEDEIAVATAELKSSFAQLTVLAASKVIGRELEEKGHEELISSVISEVGDVKWAK